MLSPAHTDSLTTRNKLPFPLSGKNHYQSTTEELQQDKLNVQPQSTPQWGDYSILQLQQSCGFTPPQKQERCDTVHRDEILV